MYNVLVFLAPMYTYKWIDGGMYFKMKAWEKGVA